MITTVKLLFAQANLERPADPEKPCSISGTVSQTGTHQPLNKVSLHLFHSGGGVADEAPFTESDSSGAFSFTRLSCVVYKLRAERTGFVSLNYGERHPGDSGSTLKLSPEEAHLDLALEVTPVGAITGTIRDSDGEPIEDAQVMVWRVDYDEHGLRHLNRLDSKLTDDLGQYVIHGLPPGKYYLSAARPHRAWAGEVDRTAFSATGRRQRAEALVETYYPRAGDANSAVPIQVEAGRRINGIDVALIRTGTACINGRLSGADATAAEGVDLGPAIGAPNPLHLSTRAQDSNGHFELCGVPPGSYTLTGYAGERSVRMALSVANEDVTGVELIPGADGAVTGQLILDANKDEKRPSLSGSSLRFTSDQGDNVSTQGGNWLSEDESFLVPQMPVGHYSVALYGFPRELYVKGIHAGSVDVLSSGLTITSAATAKIEVVLASDGAAIAGSVLNKDDEPVPGATVVLAPDQRSRADLFRTATVDQAGRYEFIAIRPGSYKVFAWDDVSANAWLDPDFLSRYEDQGEKIEFDKSSRKAANFHLVAEPERQ